jgi:lysozyme
LASKVWSFLASAEAPKLVAKIHAGDFAGAAEEFLDINKAGGQPMPGLTRRRQAERALFLT